MTKEKTLSQQICELCGMKPKEINKHNCPDVNCVTFRDDKYCEICWRRYPDFENPENFVKLLELAPNKKCPGFTLWCYMDQKPIVFSDRKEFLKYLIQILDVNCTRMQIPEDSANIIKQTIRDYDGWVWG